MMDGRKRAREGALRLLWQPAGAWECGSIIVGSRGMLRCQPTILPSELLTGDREPSSN